MKLYGLDPLESVLWVFSSQVPNAVVHTDVKSALVKLMRLHGDRGEGSGTVRRQRLELPTGNTVIICVC